MRARCMDFDDSFFEDGASADEGSPSAADSQRRVTSYTAKSCSPEVSVMSIRITKGR